jgi:hypothetical protein
VGWPGISLIGSGSGGWENKGHWRAKFFLAMLFIKINSVFI